MFVSLVCVLLLFVCLLFVCFAFEPLLVITSGMCYPVCGMVHINQPLLLFEKSSPCGGGCWFPLSLSDWLFTICPTPYNRT